MNGGSAPLGGPGLTGGIREKLAAITADPRRLLRLPAIAWQDLVSVTALVALFFYVHRYVDGLDTGGDAVSKWQFARQWSWDNDFHHSKWTHHMTRMGVNVVAWLVQRLFGAEWRSYYLAPALIGAAQVPLVYALARRVAGRFGGVLAALIVIHLPAVHTSVSQLLPDLFVGTYALLASYLLTRFAEANEPRLPLLIGAAVVAFVGYLAKETFFFFYPGFMAAVWVSRRRLRDAVIFAGVLLAGLALETLAYVVFTDYTDRLSIARSVHFAGPDADEPSEVSAAGFLRIFGHLDAPWHYLLVAAAAGALGLMIFNRGSRFVGQACVLLGVSHIALLSLASQLWQNPLPRYMIPAVPFAAVCAAFCVIGTARSVAHLIRRVWPRSRELGNWTAWLALPPTSAAVALVAASTAAILTDRQQEREPPFDGRAQGERVARLANDTYERNLPLFFANRRRPKPLAAVYDVYLSPQRLVRAGKLPDLEDVVLRRRRQSFFLVKDPSVYNQGIFDELLKERCVLEVRRGIQRGTPSFADTVQRSPLPARCDALLAKLTRPAP
jgi:hypothetical protein